MLAAEEKAAAEDARQYKWLYLLLAWVFERSESVVDLDSALEEIYSDFDYPPEMAPLIGYMPKEDAAGSSASRDTLWKAYLEDASRRFAPSKSACEQQG